MQSIFGTAFQMFLLKELFRCGCLIFVTAAKRICGTVTETSWIQTRSLRKEVSLRLNIFHSFNSQVCLDHIIECMKDHIFELRRKI